MDYLRREWEAERERAEAALDWKKVLICDLAIYSHLPACQFVAPLLARAWSQDNDDDVASIISIVAHIQAQTIFSLTSSLARYAMAEVRAAQSSALRENYLRYLKDFLDDIVAQSTSLTANLVGQAYDSSGNPVPFNFRDHMGKEAK
jgi:hypothetical protein